MTPKNCLKKKVGNFGLRIRLPGRAKKFALFRRVRYKSAFIAEKLVAINANKAQSVRPDALYDNLSYRYPKGRFFRPSWTLEKLLDKGCTKINYGFFFAGEKGL